MHSSILYRHLLNSSDQLPETLISRIWEHEQQDPETAATIVTRTDCPPHVLTEAVNHPRPLVRKAVYQRLVANGTSIAGHLNKETAPTTIIGVPVTGTDIDAAASVAERSRSKRLAAYLATRPVTKPVWQIINRLATKAVATRTVTAHQRLAITIRNRDQSPTLEPDWLNDPDLAWSYATRNEHTSNLVDNRMWNPAFQAAIEATRSGPHGAHGSLLEHRTNPNTRYPNTLTSAELQQALRRAPASAITTIVTHPNANLDVLMKALDRAQQLNNGAWMIINEAARLPDRQRHQLLAHAIVTHPTVVHDSTYQNLADNERRIICVAVLDELRTEGREGADVLLALTALGDQDLMIDVLPTSLLMHALDAHTAALIRHLPENWGPANWQLFERFLDDGYAGTLPELIEIVNITSP